MPFNKDLYPQNWNTTIRPAALKRAGYKCQDCGVYNNQKGIREATGEFIALDELILNYAIQTKKKIITIYLSVSHSNHDTTDNRHCNLRARCQYCHLKHDREYHAISRISNKSTALPPPYSSIP